MKHFKLSHSGPPRVANSCAYNPTDWIYTRSEILKGCINSNWKELAEYMPAKPWERPTHYPKILNYNGTYGFVKRYSRHAKPNCSYKVTNED